MPESKNMYANHLTMFSVDLNECSTLLRLVGVMNLILILSFPSDIQGREPFLYDFIKKKNSNVGLYSDICRPISF